MRNKILCGNTLEKLKELEGDSVDTVVTSPPYWCYSDDTELLTIDGWKLIKEATIGDKALTLNPDKNLVEWSNVTAVKSWNYKEKLYHFNNSWIDLLVTPNHKMFVTNRKGEPIKKRLRHNGRYISNKNCKGDFLVEAKDIKVGHVLPKVGFNWIGKNKDYFILPSVSTTYNKQSVHFPEIRIKMDDWLAFFGLYLAEGSCRGSKGSNKVNNITIKQKKPNDKRVRDVLNNLPFPYKEYNHRNNMTCFSITNCQLWNYLKQFGNSYKKYIPREIKELSCRYLEILLKWYLFGDGSFKSSSWYFYSTSKHLIDDISEIAIKTGKNISVYEDGRYCHLLDKYKNIKLIDFRKKVDYNGNIVGIEVEKNHIILVRRNNKIVFSGNSLRDYDCDDVIWGEDKECEHEWNIEERELDNRTTAGLNKNFDTKTGAGGKFEGKHIVKSMFCKKCGAWKGQLGMEPHPEMFINNLVEIFREVRRVLKPTGNFYLNMGDAYFGGNMCVGQPDDWDSISTKNRDKKYSNEKFDDFIKQRNKLRSNWLQPKQLMLMPSRIAVAMQDDGWILRNDLIWCLSGSVKVYAKTQKMEGPMLIKSIVRLNPSTVSLWDGRKWNKVKNFYKSQDTNGLQITLRSGERISSTLNHRWITNEGLKKTKDLAIGDVLEKTVLPQPEIPNNPLALNDDDIGYLVGMYIAEGSFGKQGKVIQIASHSKEKERHRKLKSIAEKYHCTCRKHDYGNKSTINIYGSVLIGIIKHYVYGKDSYTKGLQPRCWSRNNNFLLSLLKGYLDGDGHYESKNDRYRLGFTRNKRLADDLRTLCGRLGINIKLQYSTVNFDGREFKSFRGEIRLNVSGHFNCKSDGEITNIEKSRGNNFYDIELEDEPHIFTLASGILTHNSKPNPMPSSVTDRRNNSYEHVFHFVKEPRYYYDLDAIRVPHKSQPGKLDKKNFATFDNAEKTQDEIEKHINNVYQLAKTTKRITYEGSKTVDADDRVNAKDLTSHLATERKIARDYIKKHNLTGAVRKAVLDYAQNSGGHPKGKNPGNVMKVPYAVQPREKPYVEYRNLPDIKEFSTWLNDWRKGNGITIDEIEEKMKSQAPHHWFNGESFPSADDWNALKEIYDISNDYDKQLTEVFVKKSDKTNHPMGKNPGNAVRVEDCQYQGYSKSAHGSQDYHVSGKNPGNVLEVNTQPFKEAHFAVFPPKLIEPLIKAGCPQKVCKKCGKPMIRETEVEGKSSYELLKGKDTSHYMSEQGRKQSMRAPIESYFRKRKTVGWKPMCDCNAGYEPGIVMDIFAGSGTACLVAKQMGRDYIGIELGEKYCQMARKRLEKNVTIHQWKSEKGASIDDLEF